MTRLGIKDIFYVNAKIITVIWMFTSSLCIADETRLKERFESNQRAAAQRAAQEAIKSQAAEQARAREEAEHERYVENLGKYELKDATVFHCGASKSQSLTEGYLLRFKGGFVYRMGALAHPSLWHRLVPSSLSYDYNDKLQKISWSEIGFKALEIHLREGQIYSDNDNGQVSSDKCKMTHGSRALLAAHSRGSRDPSDLTGRDYMLVRNALRTYFFVDLVNAPANSTSEEGKLAQDVNKMFSINDFIVCFRQTRSPNTAHCDTHAEKIQLREPYGRLPPWAPIPREPPSAQGKSMVGQTMLIEVIVDLKNRSATLREISILK